jgi:hypothetical protein
MAGSGQDGDPGGRKMASDAGMILGLHETGFAGEEKNCRTGKPIIRVQGILQ